MGRPDAREVPPAFRHYVAGVPDGDVLALLDVQIGETLDLLAPVDAAGAAFRYAPGKWSVRESVAHLADTERILSTRALRIARGDTTDLPGFDQDAYVAGLDLGDRSLTSLAADLAAVRAATLSLFRSVPGPVQTRTGTVDGTPVSVRALAYAIAGHERHHQALFRERYRLG